MAVVGKPDQVWIPTRLPAPHEMGTKGFCPQAKKATVKREQRTAPRSVDESAISIDELGICLVARNRGK